MNVDHRLAEPLQETGRQHLHVAGENDNSTPASRTIVNCRSSAAALVPEVTGTWWKGSP